MNMTKRLASKSMLIGLLLTASATANAVDKDITAVFRPDPTKPHVNTFLNTTPQEGYCSRYPTNCTANNTFSLQLPIKFTSNAPIKANHDDVRQGAMFKVPANWRTVDVINKRTQEFEKVEIRISGIGVLWKTQEKVNDLVGLPDNQWGQAHAQLWEGSTWMYPPTGCGYSGSADWGVYHYASFWLVPTDVVCEKKARFLIPDFAYEYVDFAYELRTPNPLTMSDGDYEGRITYTVGPGRDFDMGDVMLSTESEVTLNMNLNVQHALKVDIPPGGNKVELEPAGGWQSWLQQGRKPTRLFRDQTFTISASSRFKMSLECSLYSGNGCGLKDDVNGYNASLPISVSLPQGLTDAGGQPVNRQLLSWGEAVIFQPGFYVDRKPGTLHFEVLPEHMAHMIQPGQSRQYWAKVTVIWDSDL